MAVPLRQSPAPAPEARRQRPARRPVSTRRHSVAGPRAMVRATVGIQASRPVLTVVPRRRRAAGVVVVVSVTLGLLMMGAAAFQIQLAQRQLQIDQLDRQMGEARLRYESLRRERSELRAPERLADVAAANTLKASRSTAYTSVSPEVAALVQQSTGMLPQRETPYGEALLDEYRQVKSLTGSRP